MGIARKYARDAEKKAMKLARKPRPMTGLNLPAEQMRRAIEAEKNLDNVSMGNPMFALTREETNGEFQSERRMFAMKGHQLFIGGEGDSRSHKEWMVRDGILTDWSDPDYEMIPRGFFLRDQLHIYRGQNFRGDGRTREALAFHLEALQLTLNIPDETNIWMGASPGDNLAQWRGHMHMGTVAEFKEYNND